MNLPKHLRDKIEKEWASYVGATHSKGVINGAESLWSILTEMSELEGIAIEDYFQKSGLLYGMLDNQIFREAARFGLALGKVKFENLDTIVQNQTVSILEYDEHITELESKLAKCVETLTMLEDLHANDLIDFKKYGLDKHSDILSKIQETLAKINGNESKDGGGV